MADVVNLQETPPGGESSLCDYVNASGRPLSDDTQFLNIGSRHWHYWHSLLETLKASGEYLNTGHVNSPNMWACQFATTGSKLTLNFIYLQTT